MSKPTRERPHQGGSFVRQGNGNLKQMAGTSTPAPQRASSDGKAAAKHPLTALEGIGAATAAALDGAGITDIATLAQLDPAEPPQLVDFKGSPNWDFWVQAAKAHDPSTDHSTATDNGGDNAPKDIGK